MIKTIDEIIKQSPIYLHNWDSKWDVITNFEEIYMSKKEYEATICPDEDIEYRQENKVRMNVALIKYADVNILFAAYGYANYSGDAFVLFEQNGKLYEVNGSHCSCYGLEDQWCTEETSLEALEFRIIDGTLGSDSYSENMFKTELMKFLGIEESE